MLAKPLTVRDAQALDAADPLAGLADLFETKPGVIFMDANSIGPMLTASSATGSICAAVAGAAATGSICRQSSATPSPP
jgi:kynureninase